MKRLVLIPMIVLAIHLAMGQTTTLVLRDSTMVNGYISMQRPGADMVFFNEDLGETAIYRWGDIHSIRKSLRPNEAKYGLDDELILKDEIILTGQIVEQVIGGKITIVLSDNGQYVEVNPQDVLKSKKVGLNGKTGLELYETRPYTNIITMNSGATHKGVILEQVIGATPNEQHLVLLAPSGYLVEIPFAEVDRYEFIPRKEE